jgi:hypothetical protein
VEKESDVSLAVSLVGTASAACTRPR